MKRTPRKRIDYTGWTVEQHIKHLSTEQVYLDYYTQFDPNSIEAFIAEYAREKHRLYEKDSYYRDEYEWYQTKFLHLADRYIDQILQKKLFNLQCQWRACLIDLPFVDIAQDFEYWTNNIRACPFIPPITETEIDLCLRFLKEGIDWSNDHYLETVWQDYDKFKDYLLWEENKNDPAAEERISYQGVEMPDLYQFFDTYQGTTGLINLPNIRGKKERKYISYGWRLGYEERVAASKAAGTYKPHKSEEVDEAGQPIPYIYVPSLYAFDASKFIETVEDEETKQRNKEYNHYLRRNHGLNYDNLDDDLKLLKEFDEPIPIEAWSDWRTAIRFAAFKFQQNKAAEMLPYAYDSYLLEFDEDETDVNKIIAKRVANFHYGTEEEDDSYSYLMHYKKEFLDGREALTGKRDFNYLEDE